MRIPPDLNTPYLIDLTDRPRPDSSRAEPVSGSAQAGNALSQTPLDQRATSYDVPEATLAKTPRKTTPAGQERRKDERRKEQRFVLLDTRVSSSRRRASRYASINLKV